MCGIYLDTWSLKLTQTHTQKTKFLRINIRKFIYIIINDLSSHYIHF